MKRQCVDVEVCLPKLFGHRKRMSERICNKIQDAVEGAASDIMIFRDEATPPRVVFDIHLKVTVRDQDE